METKLWKIQGVYQEMKSHFDDYWIWLVSEKRPDYEITGKYLFFHDDKDKLIEIARNEIENHGFHEAKVNENLLKGQTEHVLCLYYNDDSRKHELADRNKREYGVKYRYWKSDQATLKGKYSKEFLDKLPESQRKHFTRQKELIEFRDKRGNVILRQSRLKRKRKR
jgi:hypothetical protein